MMVFKLINILTRYWAPNTESTSTKKNKEAEVNEEDDLTSLYSDESSEGKNISILEDIDDNDDLPLQPPPATAADKSERIQVALARRRIARQQREQKQQQQQRSRRPRGATKRVRLTRRSKTWSRFVSAEYYTTWLAEKTAMVARKEARETQRTAIRTFRSTGRALGLPSSRQRYHSNVSWEEATTNQILFTAIAEVANDNEDYDYDHGVVAVVATDMDKRPTDEQQQEQQLGKNDSSASTTHEEDSWMDEEDEEQDFDDLLSSYSRVGVSADC